MFSRARFATLVLVAAGALALSAGAASAQTTSVNFNVSANVAENCTVSANPLNFGAYDGLAATAVTGNTTVTVRCTKGVVASIELNDGSHALSGVGRRLQTGSGATAAYLTYDLFQDTTLETRWGAGGEAVSWPAPDRAAHNLTVYGRIDADQDAVAGAYTDQIQVTVNY